MALYKTIRDVSTSNVQVVITYLTGDIQYGKPIINT